MADCRCSSHDSRTRGRHSTLGGQQPLITAGGARFRLNRFEARLRRAVTIRDLPPTIGASRVRSVDPREEYLKMNAIRLLA